MVERFQDVLSLKVGLEVQREVVGKDGIAQQDGLVQEERLGQNARDIGGGRRAIWAVDCWGHADIVGAESIRDKSINPQEMATQADTGRSVGGIQLLSRSRKSRIMHVYVEYSLTEWEYAIY